MYARPALRRKPGVNNIILGINLIILGFAEKLQTHAEEVAKCLPLGSPPNISTFNWIVLALQNGKHSL